MGYLCMVLHAHLPYVRHPELDLSLEETWLYEAMTEVYIPLLDTFERLYQDGVPYKIAMSISPPLLMMLQDPFLMARYNDYLEKRLIFAQNETIRAQNIYQMSKTAEYCRLKIEKASNLFKNRFHGDLIQGFQQFSDLGILEILACPATHGFLPLLEIHPEAVYAQVHAGIEAYKNCFKSPPKGMWLSECGYHPSIEPILKGLGIDYIISEAHGILYGNPRPVYGTYAPICSPRGVVVFPRDIDSGKQVWSASEGYPGDPCYKEFYKDIVNDLPPEHISMFLTKEGEIIPSGFKYHSITGKTDDKLLYDPHAAQQRVDCHAQHFMQCKKSQIKELNRTMKQPPVILCAYDAELFGHWWHEGPDWLEQFLRKSCMEQSDYALTTPSEYLCTQPALQLSQPTASSWGYMGYNEFWLNKENDWIYPHLHKAAELMIYQANKNCGLAKDHLQIKALNQAARELLLAQSSDWAFIMKTGTMVKYATQRFKTHLYRFLTLMDQIKSKKINEQWLNEVEYLDPIFPEIDYSIFQSSNVLQSLPEKVI